MTVRKTGGRADPELVFGVLGILLLAVFPLSAHEYSSITRFKYLQMLFLTGICVMTAAVFLRSWEKQFCWKSLPRLLCVLYAAWVGLSAFFGSYAGLVDAEGARVVLTGAVRYEGLITQVCYFLLFLVFSLSRPHRGLVLGTCAAAMAVYAAVVLCQYADWNVLDLFPKGRSTYTNYEFQGTIGNIDMVSGYLTLMIPLVLIPWILGQGSPLLLISALLGVMLETLMGVQSGLLAVAVLSAVLISAALVREDVRLRAGIAFAGTACCFALRSVIGLPWLDGTQSVTFLWNPRALLWLAAAGAAGAAGGFFRKKKTGVLRPRTVTLVWGMLLAAVILLVWLCPLGGEGSMLWEVREILHGRSSDSFGSWRWGVWRHTLAVSRESLLFGTGPDMFFYAMQDYLQETGNVLGEHFDNPHNLYLAILAGSGLPALLLYLALVFSVIRHCFRSRDVFVRAAGMSVLLYSVQGFFSFSICLVSPVAWTIFGMACAGEEEKPGGLIHDHCS
ncbi:MAG: O-antigen ligase family protein [Clostridiales bacterium]|nr:O-antigen ligase family protein [Clostridiales bacterium]